MSLTPPSVTLYTQIIFWEPCVSPHKAAFIDAVAQRFAPYARVACVAHAGIPPERRELGWNEPSTGAPSADGTAAVASVTPIVAPSPAQIAALIERGGDACLHVFSGIRWFSTLTAALKLVKQQARAFAIMSEPRDSAGVAGAVRFAQSWTTESWLRRRAQFILAIGRHGPPWFLSVGYRRDRVFPFAYFLPPPSPTHGERAGNAVSAANVANVTLSVAYVGRLTEQKGVQLLLPALGMLQRPVRLTLIGDGQARARLVQQASASGITTEFCGVLPIDEVQRRMGAFDVLVLPSICKDGWGAVVSEALLCGTAVVASHCAGASILLERPHNGRVVPPADSAAIATAIADLERSGALTATARERRLQWARERLTARAGAAYFERIVRHRSGVAERPPEFYA